MQRGHFPADEDEPLDQKGRRRRVCKVVPLDLVETIREEPVEPDLTVRFARIIPVAAPSE
jgi:hypothetical protein